MAPQNSYNSNIKDHQSQVTITNIVMMKKLEILWESPKCDTDTWSEQVLLKNDTNRFVQPITTNVQFVKKKKKKATTAKAKHDKTRYTCICSISLIFPKVYSIEH